MKSFLTAWLAEAPTVLARELGGKLELRPSAQLPQPETAANIAIVLKGPFQGRFLVTADRYALQALLAGARVTDGSVDPDRDRELWCGILRQIATHTAEAFNVAQGCSLSIEVEDADWSLGLPSAAYELRFGDTVLLLAFTEEIQNSAAAPPEILGEVGNEAVSDAVRSRTIAPRGVDLLLDVELEASLRFGSREMLLSEVLDLGAGDVVELDRHVSDPVDLLVGDKIVARGEVVLVNGSFGLRVLEVAEPRKCLESIRCLF
jgi:flagellar motor switch protein FliN